MSTRPPLLPQTEVSNYLLLEKICEAPDQELWQATQTSINREVELVCYYGDDLTGFLDAVRIKANQTDSTLGAIYEAFEEDGAVYCAREILPSTNLTALEEAGETLEPAIINRIIGQIASSLEKLTSHEVAIEQFDGSSAWLDSHGNIRLSNIATIGPLTSDEPTRHGLVNSLRPLIRSGRPAASRMNTLLDFIVGTAEQPALPWSEVKKLTEQVVEQLETTATTAASPSPPPKALPAKKKSGTPLLITCIILALALIGGSIFLIKHLINSAAEYPTITIPKGNYPQPDGTNAELGAFLLDSTEVTIREYADFIAKWQQMSREERKELWAENTPEDKKTVIPDDWEALFKAAQEEKTWHDRQVGMDYPVVGVDWWDAQAFAKWKGGHLPTDQEWWAIIHSKTTAAQEKPGWNPVSPNSQKVVGLADNVSEWCGNFSQNPSFPMDAAKPTALGTSFEDKKKNALHRQWLKSPSQRLPNLGFRVAYDIEP